MRLLFWQRPVCVRCGLPLIRLFGLVVLLLILRVVWSRRQPLASVGAVLSLLDGPSGCDPAFCVVWFTFRKLRRYLAYRPGVVSW